MSVIETSKELLRCAEYLKALADFTNCSEETEKDLNQWAELLKSIAIPAPLNRSDDEPNR